MLFNKVCCLVYVAICLQGKLVVIAGNADHPKIPALPSLLMVVVLTLCGNFQNRVGFRWV